MALKDIVQVNITRDTQAVKLANFGTPALIDEFDPGSSPPFTGRMKAYADLAELTADGYSSPSFVYDAATKIFAQNPSVTSIKVGAKFITTTPDADWTAALTAINNEDPGWYGFDIKSTTIADQEDAADWVETQKKIYFARSADADILDSGVTTDIASYAESNNYDRTTVYYDASAEADYISAAAMGQGFPFDPGEQTWAYKTLVGVTATALTSAERTDALAKNANIYIGTAGVDHTEFGKVGSGEYIDIIRGIDWLEAIIQQAIFSELVNTKKIPYTDEGASIIDAILKGQLDRAVRATIIVDDYVTSVPKVADVPTNDKINRFLPDVTFTATLQGAIHTVRIDGVVSV